MSSDNRTNAIIQQRVQSSVRQSSRKCSFCSCTGHNITQCNDGRFVVFELICIQQKHQLLNLYPAELDNPSVNMVSILPIQEFISRLIVYALENTSRMVKSYAVRKCGATTRESIFTCIEKISIYIFNLTSESNYLINDPNFQSNALYTMLNQMSLLNSTSDTVETAMLTKFKIESILDLTDDNEGEIGCDVECNICYESLIQNKFVKLNCSHSFCGTCIENTLKICKDTVGPRCAMCREPINSMWTKDININTILAEYILA